MNRSLALTLAVVFALPGTLIGTQGNAADLMSPRVAARLGLTQAWARPVHVPYGAASIADQQLFVHQENPREFVEIVTTAKTTPTAATGSQPAPGNEGKVLARIVTGQIGDGGKLIDKKEAERLANNEIRRLKRRGIEATINVRTVPRVHLYTVGTDGTLECRDAESGEPLWMVRVGDRRLPYRAIGTNEEFLTIINGANLIQVEAATGEVMEEVRMTGTPIFGAVNSGDFAMIPIIGGGVEGYPLYDPTRDPFTEIVDGSALALPTKAPGSTRIGWGTNRGFVYVMEMQGTPSVLFRLDTDGIVSGRIAAATGDRFFFGSESGQVYGLRATRSGTVLWSQPFGEPFYNEPMVVGDQLLLRSTYGNLFSLSVDQGVMTWDDTTQNVGDILGAFGGRAFITTLSGAFAVIDLETGERTSLFHELRPGRLLVNTLTDRLYLVSESGDVQCLRPENAEIPNFNVQPDVQPDEEKAKAKPVQEPATSPFDPGGSDPFGAGGADPFGGGDAGADPFGGGGDAPMDDPFGGNNPFGN